MTIYGYPNIQDQLNRQGEFNNPQQETLFDWVSRKTAPNAVFAGPMPLTANLRYSIFSSRLDKLNLGSCGGT